MLKSAVVAVVLAQGLWVVLGGSTHLPREATALLLASLVLASGFSLHPASEGRSGVGELVIWCLALAIGATALVAFRGRENSDPILALRVGSAVAVLALVLGSAHRLLARLLGSGDRARLALAVALGLAGAAPVWLGPLADRLGSRAFVNGVLWASPLGYLASMTEYDYLRSRWFYVHSPVGSLRFDAPPKGRTTAAYLLLGSLLLGAEHVRSRCRR